jgi:translation elongation factor EF-1alpha
MGRLLYELGRVDEKTRIANERGSNKIGKSSFSWAWQLDGTAEERERLESTLLPLSRRSMDLTGVSLWMLRYSP